jgi:hypothetical protein
VWIFEFTLEKAFVECPAQAVELPKVTSFAHREEMPQDFSLRLSRWNVPFYSFIACCLILNGLCQESSLTFYVAPSGNDAADGSRNHPFATLERARDAVRAQKKSATGLPVGGVCVELESGVYRRSQPLVLSTEDSGELNAPVVWKSRAMKGAHIEVGVAVADTDFVPVEADEVKRLAPEAVGKVYCLSLSKLGARHCGPYPLNFDNGGGIVEWYCDGERQPLSRWPNDGPARMERVLGRGESAPGVFAGQGKFVAREERVGRWPVERGVWLEGYWRVPWDVRTVKVAAIDAATREITLAAPVGGGIGSKYSGPQGSGREPWWAVNLLEEIDQPGEWSLDFQTQKVFWWPPEGWCQKELVLADLAEPAIRVEKASNLRIEGLSLGHGLSNGLEIRDSQRVTVAGCLIKNFAGAGVVVQKGSQVTVQSCDLSELGLSGIVLSGGDRATLTPCGHVAENNHIQRVGVLKKTYSPGILVGIFGAGDAVGCRVAHNFIHQVPHAGIQYGGNDHVFEYNEISQAVLTSDDMGAFYTTNDWTSCGNVLRYNFVHHSPRAISFYMDDGDGGDTIFANVSYEMQAGPAVCGGHYNTVRNNLVARCKRGLFIDARGIARKYDKESSLFKKLRAVPFDRAPWTERFPFLKDLPDSDTRLPQGNVITDNVSVFCESALRLAAKPEDVRGSVLKDNLDLKERDPLFVNEAGGDLTLKPESPVFVEAPNFEKIPFSKIGLFNDAFRTTLPKREWQSLPEQWSPH